MATTFHSTLLDNGLNGLVNHCDKITLLNGDPGSNYMLANVTNVLGSVTLTTGAGNGDWTLQSDGAGGRKATLSQQTVTISSPGTITHIAYLDTANSRVLLVYPYAGGAVTFEHVLNTHDAYTQPALVVV